MPNQSTTPAQTRLVGEKIGRSKIAQARAVLFIYRMIDRGQSGFTKNPHQDASGNLFQPVPEAALRHSLVTLRVPHGALIELMHEDGLDLFDEPADPGGPLKDKRFTACFWAQVGEMAEAFGALGSRTGSLDIASFVGLDYFKWDEPLLQEVETKDYLTGWDALRLSQQQLEEQVPQHLRLLTQRSFISISLLAKKSIDPLTGRYARIDEEQLETWLAGGRHVFPRQGDENVH